MIQIGKTLVSDELLSKDFVCNLSKCKGVCCVEGDAGAPLEKEELKILEEIYPKVKPFLRAEGIEAIEQQGKYVVDFEGDYVTPLVNEKECAYVVFDEKGHTKCGIEIANEAGEVDYKKPISCHLYPVRVQKFTEVTAVNYHKWNICNDACAFGEELQVKVYEFLKEPLIRKFGENWYEELLAKNTLSETKKR